jgi:hypothetical protein
MYKSLLAASFQPRHIEQAMTAVIAKGGDIVDVLDWLCLNLPDGECMSVEQMSVVIKYIDTST